MALLQTITIPTTVVTECEYGRVSLETSETSLKDVYIKVEKINGTKELCSFEISLAYNEIKGLKTYSFAPVMEDKNFIAQAYEHLKTLPEFSDAVDC